MVGGFRNWAVISLYAMATLFMPNRVYIWLCLGLSTLSVMRSLSVPCQAVPHILRVVRKPLEKPISSVYGFVTGNPISNTFGPLPITEGFY